MEAQELRRNSGAAAVLMHKAQFASRGLGCGHTPSRLASTTDAMPCAWHLMGSVGNSARRQAMSVHAKRFEAPVIYMHSASKRRPPHRHWRAWRRMHGMARRAWHTMHGANAMPSARNSQASHAESRNVVERSCRARNSEPCMRTIGVGAPQNFARRRRRLDVIASPHLAYERFEGALV